MHSIDVATENQDWDLVCGLQCGFDLPPCHTPCPLHDDSISSFINIWGHKKDASANKLYWWLCLGSAFSMEKDQNTTQEALVSLENRSNTN